MNDILEIIKMMPYIYKTRTRYYKISDLYNRVKELESEVLRIDEDISLLPFYIDNGRIYELYYHEFYVNVNIKESEYEQYILEITGKKHISEIPKDIRERLEICECITSKNEIDKNVLLKFVEHLYTDDTVYTDITSVYGTFDKEKFFFEIY